MQKLEEMRHEDPDFDKKKDFFEKRMNEWIKNNPQGKKNKIVVTIPVVVHVLWRTASQNLSDTRIQEQIDVLNADYRRTNSDTGNTPAPWKSIAADIEVDFCLAVRDPNDLSTTGIERRQVTTSNIGSTSSYYQYSSGGLNVWDRNYYLNIWVCEIGGGTLGYTNGIPPSLAPANRDGIVIDYRYFGKTGASAPFNLGRTTTHEVGHWLGLYHTWGDDGGSCSGSDNVSDTPNQADANYGCPAFPRTDACTATSPGVIFMNYEDYTDDDCMNMFTNGQKTKMWSAINGSRPGLQSSQGCVPVNQNAPPVCNFSALPTSVFTGDTVQFTDLSTNSPASWSWTFQGGTPDTSALQNPEIVYNTTGLYDVTLTATNSFGTCSATTKISYIEVQGWNATCDTATNIKISDNLTLYASDQWGFVTGQNNWGDKGFADFISVFPNGYNLTSAIFLFGKAAYADTNRSITVKAWSNNGTGGSPGTILLSQNVPISSFAADVDSQAVTVISFTTPAIMNNPFYLGYEVVYSPGDTVGCLTTEDGNTVPGTAWSLFSDDTWYPFSNSSVNWGINVALAVWPEFCNPQGIQKISAVPGYVFVFPNPSNGMVTLLTDWKNFSIKFFNLPGKEIMAADFLNAAERKFDFDLSPFPSGSYLVKIISEEKTVTQKIFLMK